ncbi:hypothetical protein ACHWGR_08270, partial [Klebsiella pneumoniae]|uniref:T6SS phospholipase effector Tle1-like catalytic domain-containing protein n=1 Tax=Klebsiella pneumoniae TaxID=573 RepID=UPI00376F3ACE
LRQRFPGYLVQHRHLQRAHGGAQLRAFTHEPGTVVAQQKARKAEEQLARGQAALPASWLEDVLTTTV